MATVDVQHASFSYARRPVFQDLTFSVGEGEIFCLLGPNGCGKTTLLDCILGLHRLDAGTVRISGRNARNLTPRRRAKSIAYVPQRHERGFPYTVKQMVLMGRAAYLHMFQAPSGEDETIARDAMAHLSMAHLGDRRYTELSGGETQLVMIARALAQQAPIIIMDEPTAHLDFRHELVILETIGRLAAEHGLSILMATHFPNHAFYFQNSGVKTTAALLHDAGFRSMGMPEEVINAQTIQALYGVDAEVVSVIDSRGRTLKHIVPMNTVASS